MLMQRRIIPKHPDRNYCYIDKTYTKSEICQYVQDESDKCEGGGYFTWTRWTECASSSARVFIIIGAIFYMLYLFVAISAAADDFFSPNVAGIVAHLGISESIAGVTFMAFGNGAPDIFGAIASVLSTPKPKAGFAVGELLGAGTFVTLCVTATIVFTKQFKAAVFETIRDLSFYLLALGWILFVFIYDKNIYLFEPLVCLGIYGCYVGTVVFSHFLHKRRKAARRASRRSSHFSRNASVRPNIAINDTDKNYTDGPPVHIISAAVDRIAAANGNLLNGVEKENPNPVPKPGDLRRLSVSLYARRRSQTSRKSTDKSNNLHPGVYHNEAHHGDSDSDSEEMIWVGHHLISASANRSRAQSIIPPAEIHSAKSLFADIYHHLLPISSEDWDDAGYFGKFMLIISVPLTIAFCLTIPLVDQAWSKPVALLHAFFAPQFFLFAIQDWNLQPFDGSPGLWAYALVFSLIVEILLILYTTVQHEPRFYKQLSSYAGFLMSISWIYLVANEVVSVVTMLGVISQLSHELLGLTILAWANSIGDLIADVAVVKQGYSNMALAAAIGGPLFNLLIGFGLPFSIARAKGTPIEVNFSTINHVLVLFLGTSLAFSLIAMIVQRFYLRKVYAACLIGIYAAFLTMVALTETKVFTWGGDDD
ncbi:unnamed protein product, partial [Mesorhabditis belari]|uniref:Sodium/calcium exchanger membrane region domain-containing protein n=1 Tax=Mesorhabditis belari TaxID=2138241 RepID=A0AAF3E8N0_9BILA